MRFRLGFVIMIFFTKIFIEIISQTATTQRSSIQRRQPLNVSISNQSSNSARLPSPKSSFQLQQPALRIFAPQQTIFNPRQPSLTILSARQNHTERPQTFHQLPFPQSLKQQQVIVQQRNSQFLRQRQQFFQHQQQEKQKQLQQSKQQQQQQFTHVPPLISFIQTQQVQVRPAQPFFSSSSQSQNDRQTQLLHIQAASFTSETKQLQLSRIQPLKNTSAVLNSLKKPAQLFQLNTTDRSEISETSPQKHQTPLGMKPQPLSRLRLTTIPPQTKQQIQQILFIRQKQQPSSSEQQQIHRNTVALSPISGVLGASGSSRIGPLLPALLPSLSIVRGVSASPPGVQPPNNSVVEQLNNAENFLEVAARLRLTRARP